MEITETHITIVLKTDGSEFAAKQTRELLKRLHETERQWEKELGKHERDAFLQDPVRFETANVITSFHQTGKPLRFADEG